MAKPTLPRPTDGELEILRILWRFGFCTVRQVHEALSRRRPTVYTSTLKLLQIMHGKGLVDRDEGQRTHIYRPRVNEEATQRQLVGDLLDRVFDGSAQKLLVQALASRKASAAELAELRKVLDSLEGGNS
jgi:BlaI family transcriptional regulator, penicillinase repressor